MVMLSLLSSTTSETCFWESLVCLGKRGERKKATIRIEILFIHSKYGNERTLIRVLAQLGVPCAGVPLLPLWKAVGGTELLGIWGLFKCCLLLVGARSKCCLLFTTSAHFQAFFPGKRKEGQKNRKSVKQAGRLSLPLKPYVSHFCSLLNFPCL